MTDKSIYTLEDLTRHKLVSGNDSAAIAKVIDNFSLSVTPAMYKLIDKNDINDPIAKQFIPQVDELNILPIEREDPIGDNAHGKVKGIVHRYPDRCLFTPVLVCPVYCRFCFRRERVGQVEKALTPDELELAYKYIEDHPNIWEVILTGGDPLIMKPEFLDKILQRLENIQHVEIIRIHTRIPVVDPNRISSEMVQVLRRKKALYICLHANHANEFSPEAIAACASLVDAGIPMLSQSVLLKGINDNIETLSELMRAFIRNRIKPYYLHQGDLAKGTMHFRTSIEEGQALMQQLRGRFSGICQPTYILDIPGGYGKSPIGPSYITKISDESESESRYHVVDYQENKHIYPPQGK